MLRRSSRFISRAPTTRRAGCTISRSPGARARARFASREALGYFDRALVLVDELTDPEERNLRETKLRLARGRAPGDPHGFGAELVRENSERVSDLSGTLAATR